MPKSFCKIDKYLRIAVGLEIPDASLTRRDRVIAIPQSPGVAEMYPYPKRKSLKVYFDMGGETEPYTERIEVIVSEVLQKAPWAEILFNNNKPGAKLTFGRENEEMPFWPCENGRYGFLRIYRQREHPFNPVYIRIDEGAETRFLVVRASWEGDKITLEVERDPEEIPYFLS